MYAARILYPVRVLGPGERIGVWLSGCHRACPGCSNPELWEQREEQRISVEQLSELLHRLARERQVDGVTITGGEPFAQCGELALLLKKIADITDDVLIFTGYLREELDLLPEAEAVLERTAVLIDGPYVQALNDGLPLRGSRNQRIHYLKAGVQSRYEAFLTSGGPAIQNFTLGSSVVSVGIHRADYASELDTHTIQKGLVTDE